MAHQPPPVHERSWWSEEASRGRQVRSGFRWGTRTRNLASHSDNWVIFIFYYTEEVEVEGNTAEPHYQTVTITTQYCPAYYRDNSRNYSKSFQTQPFLGPLFVCLFSSEQWVVSGAEQSKNLVPHQHQWYFIILMALLSPPLTGSLFICKQTEILIVICRDVFYY